MSKNGPSISADYCLDDQAGYLLRLANQRHIAIFQNKILVDLTPTQFSALVRLAEVGGCSQNDLGRRTSMDVATIKGVVDRLLAKGLVRQTTNPEDKRQKVVELTESGKVLIPRLHELGVEITNKTLDRLNSRERLQFVRLINKLT